MPGKPAPRGCHVRAIPCLSCRRDLPGASKTGPNRHGCIDVGGRRLFHGRGPRQVEARRNADNQGRPPTYLYEHTYTNYRWPNELGQVSRTRHDTKKNTTLTQPSPRPIGSGLTHPDSRPVKTPTHNVDPNPTRLMGLTRSDPTNLV